MNKLDCMTITALYERHSPSGKTLFCGSKIYEGSHDRRGWYPDRVGVDIQEGEGVDLVQSLEDSLGEEIYQHVDCCSVFEHVRNPWAAAKSIQDAMAPGATILFSVPFVWRYHAYPNDYYRYTAEGVRVLFDRVEWLELGYYANSKLKKKPETVLMNDSRYLERTEVIGYGIKL